MVTHKILSLSKASEKDYPCTVHAALLGREKGKFKPKAEKAAQLAALAKKGKEEVRKLLGEKKTEQEEKPKQPKMRGSGPGKKATKHQKK